jgi:hypothetical protein
MEVGTKQDYVKLMQSNNPSAGKFNMKLVDLIDAWMKAKMAKS